MARAQRHIFLSCGEASGERYGADLVSALRALDPGLRISALGGRQVADRGADLIHDAGQLGVMGFGEVLRAWPAIAAARKAVGGFLKRETPDLVVPVDFPGFNSWVAGKAHGAGLPVFWLVAPQLWAWGRWRAAGLRRKIDSLGTILPFEEKFFQELGFDVFPMGHPLMDQYGGQFPFRDSWARREAVFNDRNAPLTIGLIPGSRRQELRHLLPVFKVTAQALRGHLNPRPLRFVASVAPGMDARLVAEALGSEVDVSRDSLPALLPRLDLALVCSGTASLEAALAGVPHEVVYRTGRFDYFLARRLVKVPYIGLGNLVLDEGMVREHVQDDASPLLLTRSLLRWLSRPEARDGFFKGCERVRRSCGPAGVWRRTAEALLATLDSRAGGRAGGDAS